MGADVFPQGRPKEKCTPSGGSALHEVKSVGALIQSLLELRLHSGEVAEWPNVPDSKSGVPQGTVGSNPTLSAKMHKGLLL